MTSFFLIKFDADMKEYLKEIMKSCHCFTNVKGPVKYPCISERLKDDLLAAFLFNLFGWLLKRIFFFCVWNSPGIWSSMNTWLDFRAPISWKGTRVQKKRDGRESQRNSESEILISQGFQNSFCDDCTSHSTFNFRSRGRHQELYYTSPCKLKITFT